MPETKTEVRVFKVERVCDKCGKWKMAPAGVAYMTHPAQYQHSCEGCGERDIYCQSYPWYSYEELSTMPETDLAAADRRRAGSHGAAEAASLELRLAKRSEPARMTDGQIAAAVAALEPALGPTRAGWYGDACAADPCRDGLSDDAMLWAIRYRELAREAGAELKELWDAIGLLKTDVMLMSSGNWNGSVGFQKAHARAIATVNGLMERRTT